MRFWDSSALAALLVDEAVTPAVERVLAQDPVVFVWWGTRVECASAIARQQRERQLSGAGAESSFERLRELQRRWHEIQPAEELRESAVRLLRVHSLSAADAFQLAAAFVAAERRPPSLEFVCLDEQLSEAARREGFPVVETRPPSVAREPRRRYRRGLARARQ
jgi:hypothetical protein